MISKIVVSAIWPAFLIRPNMFWLAQILMNSFATKIQQEFQLNSVVVWINNN